MTEITISRRAKNLNREIAALDREIPLREEEKIVYY
jgi:hypothetical protein